MIKEQNMTDDFTTLYVIVQDRWFLDPRGDWDNELVTEYWLSEETRDKIFHMRQKASDRHHTSLFRLETVASARLAVDHPKNYDD
jgi:hypothetical protein